jgi:hypothetical protein
MRPRQFWIYITIYIAVITLLFFTNYTAYQFQDLFGDLTRFFKSIYNQFLVLQVIVLCVLGAFNSGSAIKNEITGKSYDFFRLLPISAGKKAVGILVGKNLVVLLLAGINFLLLIIFGMLGQVDTSLLGQTFLALISVAVLLSSITLLSSIRSVGKQKKSNTVAIIFLIIFLGPFIIQALIGMWFGASQLDKLGIVIGKFYTFELPILILFSLVILYFSCWSIKGILRRFTREDESLFTRFGAYLFMLGFEFVLFGLFYTYLKDGARRTNNLFWLISLFPVLLIPFGSIRSFDKYLEHSGLMQSRLPENKNIMPRMLLYSNLFLSFCLFTIWALCSIGTTVIAGQDLLHHLYLIFILFSFYLFLMLLLELYVVYTSHSNKIGLLLVFITAVYIILPLILSGILEIRMIYKHSPAGFIFELLYPFRKGEVSVQPSVWVVNLILCIIPIILIWKRYKHILAARSKM